MSITNCAAMSSPALDYGHFSVDCIQNVAQSDGSYWVCRECIAPVPCHVNSWRLNIPQN